MNVSIGRDFIFLRNFFLIYSEGVKSVHEKILFCKSEIFSSWEKFVSCVLIFAKYSIERFWNFDTFTD